MSKKSSFRGPFDKYHGKGDKHFSKLNDSNLTIFIDPCEYNWGLKSFSDSDAES